MAKRGIIVSLGLLVVGLVSCQGLASGVSGEMQQQLASIETKIEGLSQRAGTGELEGKLEELGMRLDEADLREQVFQVSMANFVLETADFHEIDVSVNEEGVIDPEFPGTVSRVQALLSGTTWPEELHSDLAGLQGTLVELADALSADDLDAAGPLAAQVHEQQHEFSHVVGAWLAGQSSGMAMEGMDHDDNHSHDEGQDREHGDRIPNEGGATIQIQSPADGGMFMTGDDVVVEVQVTDFALGENGNHWHVYVDDVSFGMVVGGKLFQVLSGLEPGEHVISAYLTNGDHQEYEEGASITIMVHDGN